MTVKVRRERKIVTTGGGGSRIDMQGSGESRTVIIADAAVTKIGTLDEQTSIRKRGVSMMLKRRLIGSRRNHPQGIHGEGVVDIPIIRRAPRAMLMVMIAATTKIKRG